MLEEKTEREYITDEALDSREHRWWNDNATIIAQVWQMHDDVSWTVRRKHLRRAKDFLLDGKRKVVVLEPGCGSGWVGQLIAGPELRILGTDFSESQIQLATENAKRKHLDEYCKYVVANSDEWPGEIQEVDGVLIYCFLHHLSGKELEELLQGLKNNLKRDTRVWIYEPAFYLSPKSTRSQLSAVTRFSLKITLLLLRILSGIYSRYDLVNKTVAEAFSELTHQAEERGWYLSPKEIPFEVGEFSNQLEEYFVVSNHYWSTIYVIGWVQASNSIKHDKVRKLVSRLFLPFFAFTDARLSKENNYLGEKMVAPNYAFHVWECITP